MGTRVSSTQTNYKQGAFETTNNPLDLAIEGDGFFQVDNPNGGFYYTRAGNFNLNVDGQIVLGSATNGYLLEPNITVPPEATGIVISSDGHGSSTARKIRPTLQIIGQIQLAKFINPDGLLKLGDNLYQQTDASGDPYYRQPRTGRLRQHSARFFGSVECRAGERADRFDYDAALVRVEFTGGSGG